MITEEQRWVAEHYGLRHQAAKMLEEMGELQVEIARYLARDERQDAGAMIEELADTINVAQQLLHLLNAEEVAERLVDEKASREIRRISERHNWNHPDEIIARKYAQRDPDTLKMLSIFDP